MDGTIDPLRDIETIQLELVLADLAACEKRVEKYKKMAKSGDKEAKLHHVVAERLVEVLGDGKPVTSGEWTDEEWTSIRHAQLLTSKPVLYICNVDEDGIGGNEHVDKVKAHAAAEGAGVVVICAQIEAEISELEDPEERAEFLGDVGLAEPGLHLLARETYRLLGLQTYFTAGEKEVRAWTIKQGFKAPQAAGVIHTDFERGFIRAEVYHHRRPDRVWQRGRAEGRGEDAGRGEGVCGAGRGCDALPVQRLTTAPSLSGDSLLVRVPGAGWARVSDVEGDRRTTRAQPTHLLGEVRARTGDN